MIILFLFRLEISIADPPNSESTKTQEKSQNNSVYKTPIPADSPLFAQVQTVKIIFPRDSL